MAGYFLAIDFTNRGLGSIHKKDGAPWCLMKGSDGFCAVSDMMDINMIPDVSKLRLQLKNNGFVKQSGWIKEMIMPIPEQIEYLSKYVTLSEGDMIITGTPHEPDFIKPGDIIETCLYSEETLLMSMLTPII